MNILAKTNKIEVICPICKTRDIIGIPSSRLNKKSQLTTISVHKGLICPHHFQFFIDNNFQIRGYQKVDFELNQANSTKLINGVKAFNLTEKKDPVLFEQLIIEGDKVNSKSFDRNDINKISSAKLELISKKKLTPKEIYEEFWEFIDENNSIFHEFIINDNRRPKSSLNSHISKYITV
ncbi:MAG: hypothetical protein ACFFDY_08890 [Candidatus Thorarchaeota archaeon]